VERRVSVRIKHLLLTRFNIQPWKGDRPTQHLDPAWLDDRIDLFQRSCVPAVEAQTVQDFAWYLLIDPRTPDPTRAALEAASRYVRLIEVEHHAAKGDVTRNLVLEACEEGSPDVILQTRVDSDDALAPDYLEVLREEVHGSRKEFLDFPHGYQLDTRHGHVVRRTWPSSPFMNLTQPPSAYPISIHDVPHTEVTRIAPLRSIAAHGMWLQVLHGRNVSSELLPGLPVPAQRIADRFPVDRSLLSERSTEDYARDIRRWGKTAAREVVSRRTLKSAVPARLVDPLRERRRRKALARVLSELRVAARPPSVEELERLVDAWGRDRRTPSTAFLAEVVAAANRGGRVVVVGAGIAALLLSARAPERTWVLEPDPDRHREVYDLLEAVGAAEMAARRLIRGGPSELPWDPHVAEERAKLLVVNSSPDHGASPGGYALARAASSVVAEGGTILLDDAHEAHVRDALPEPPGGGEIGWRVAPTKHKPFVRGTVRTSVTPERTQPPPRGS
jgi:hypothetical protein